MGMSALFLKQMMKIRSDPQWCSFENSTRVHVIQNRHEPPTKLRAGVNQKVQARGRTLGNFALLV